MTKDEQIEELVECLNKLSFDLLSILEKKSVRNLDERISWVNNIIKKHRKVQKVEYIITSKNNREVFLNEDQALQYLMKLIKIAKYSVEYKVIQNTEYKVGKTSKVTEPRIIYEITVNNKPGVDED